MWNSMFDLDLSIIEKMLRPLIVYTFLVIGFRLAGKRELAQLNSMDLIVLLTLSNTVQNAIIGNDNSVTGGIIGASTLLFINYVFVRFLFSHEKFDRLVEGEAAVLIEGGRLREDQMQKELVTKEELLIAAHKQGFASLDDVDQAVLEAGGVISFVGKKPGPDELRQTELTKRLDHLVKELASLRAVLATKS